MVSLEELDLDLVVVSSYGPADLEEVDMRNVVISLPSQVFLSEVSGQFRCDQLQIFLALAI